MKHSVSLSIFLTFSLSLTMPFTGYASPLLQSTAGPQQEISLAEAQLKTPESSFNNKTADQDQSSTLFMQDAETLSHTETSTSAFLGVEEGDTVSGTIEVRPNPDQLPGVRKVQYYLNGTQSGKVYQSPFIWGGPAGDGTTGFDTTKISDGNYRLLAIYTDKTGDHRFTVNFTVDNSSTPPPTDPDETILGVKQNETVSGFVDIHPNPEKLPAGTTQVTWTLEGGHTVVVTEEPYRYGGPAGNGTQTFDTRSLADGVYRLIMSAQGTNTSAGAEVTFVVENEPDPVPSTSPIAPSGRTAGGLQFPSSASLVDVEQAGNFSLLADTAALYIVNASSPAQPVLVSAVDFNFAPPIVDIAATPDGKAVFVLESGPDNDNTGTNIGRLWRVDITDPGNPVRELIEAGTPSTLSRPKRLVVHEDMLFVVFDEEHAVLPCELNGSGCGTPDDLYSLRDLMFINDSGNYSAITGGTVIRGVPGGTTNDFSQTTTPAAIGFLSGKGDFLFASLRNGTTAIYNTAQRNPTTGVLPLVKTIDPQGANPIYSVVEGNHLAILDSTGLVETFDIANIQSAARIDSFTVSGARKIALHDGVPYVVTSNQYRIIKKNDAASDSRILGVTEGQTVSGVVQIRPNLEQISNIKKVAYYLNGTQSGKVYKTPFIWGGLTGDGTTGFDTRTIADGLYTLTMVYTDPAGDHRLTVSFRVDN